MAEEKPKYLQRLMLKWDLTSTTQVIIILIVFSLTGTTVVFAKGYYLDFLGMTESNWFLKILVVLLAYQIFLLVYGGILGQFGFFWKKLKKFGVLLQKLVMWPLSLFNKNQGT